MSPKLNESYSSCLRLTESDLRLERGRAWLKMKRRRLIRMEGLELANERDTELERGEVDAVEEDEFRRWTGGMNEG